MSAELQHPPGEALSAFVDGELAQDVQAHLAECRDCRELAADLAWVGDVLRNMAVPSLPPDWEDRLIARVRSGERGTVVALRRRVAVTAAAVAALVAAAVFSFVPHDPTAAPPVAHMVVSHATSSGGGDPSRLAPAAVSASFGGP